MNTYPRAFILFVVLTSNFVIDAMMRRQGRRTADLKFFSSALCCCARTRGNCSIDPGER